MMLLFGCTTQTPVSQAPVYNVTVTDNSQYVVGDNNKAETKPVVRAEQVAKPDVVAEATKKDADWFLFWCGVLAGAIICFSAGFVYLKYLKRKA